MFKKCYLGRGENLVSFYLTTCKWASICLAKRKMISLFKKIVLLATNFFLRLWLRKQSILKSFSGTKKVFFMDIFLKEKFCAYVFSADKWIERTRVPQGRKFLGGCILSVLWVRKYFSLFFFSSCLFCCPKMETVFRVVIFIFVSQFRRCHAGSPILVFWEMVIFL